MPQLPRGFPNPNGACCPECGAVLVFDHKRGVHERIYVCPRAKLEHGLPGSTHSALWDWRAEDLLKLADGKQTAWHVWARERKG